MITRTWYGKTKAADADVYLKYMAKTGMKECRSTPGNLSAQILRRIEDDVCHFWVLTKWDSTESIKSFAGDDHEKARFYPEDKKYLIEFEKTVTHCETFEY